MYTTIVVGTDGSDTAAIALRHATDVAKAGGGTLHIVNVYQPVNTLGMALAGVSDDVEAVEAGLAEHARAICAPAAEAAKSQGVPSEIHTIAGDPSDALVAIAEQVHADLLVVGNRGMAGMRRVLGSVPNKISHHAPCSVLIVDTRH
jgi:Universal stress protein UspA and related nucleotide-binding proteins